MTDGIHTVAGIEYDRQSEVSLQLDLHRPAGDEPVPVVAYFHGGGWARGSRGDRAAERLLPVVRAGIAVASIDYRLIDTATHPAQLEDARSAVRWLRSNGEEYGLATERIGAWGTSAGGWIALMLGCVLADASAGVQAVVAWQPPCDLTQVSAQRSRAGLPLPAFFGDRPAPNMEVGLLGLSELSDDLPAALEASPLTHAADAAAPILLVHGDGDGLVNCAQSAAMHEALRAAGRASQLLVLPGANHEDPEYDSPAVLGATAAFLLAAL